MFLTSKIKLDILEIKEFSGFTYGHDTSETTFELIRQLHEQGFYKRLFIYVNYLDNNDITSLIQLKGLELLCIRQFSKRYNIPKLTNLKELIILGGSNAEDMKILAGGMLNLGRLYSYYVIYSVFSEIEQNQILTTKQRCSVEFGRVQSGTCQVGRSGENNYLHARRCLFGYQMDDQKR